MGCSLMTIVKCKSNYLRATALCWFLKATLTKRKRLGFKVNSVLDVLHIAITIALFDLGILSFENVIALLRLLENVDSSIVTFTNEWRFWMSHMACNTDTYGHNVLLVWFLQTCIPKNKYMSLWSLPASDFKRDMDSLSVCRSRNKVRYINQG